LTSNGWQRTTPFINRIRPTQEVNWFGVENEQWVEVYSDSGSTLADEEYYVYGEDSASDHRAEHMPSLLQISDVEDGVYLLNPEAVTPDGEWEAWFFANWIPGARRYPSFAHLMQREYESFASLEKIKRARHKLPNLETPGPDVPRIPAERLRKKVPKAPSLVELIEKMRSPDEKTRAKAVRTVHGKLKGRFHAQRRPDLVQSMTDLFYTTRDPGVRGACIAAITEIAEDGTKPAPLFDALSDPDPGVVLMGMFALTYFPDNRAAEPLCRFIESGVNALFNEQAMHKLGEIGDERAVPTLLRVLLNTHNPFDQSFGTAGVSLGRCGSRGFDALAAALGHDDARVRLAAVVGLDTSGDPRAAAFLDQMDGDADRQVRERAKVRVGKPHW
jgi:hypothetical protein